MDKKEIIESIKKQIEEKDLKKDLDGYQVFLFGSRSKNSSKKKSDIDIGIKGKEKIPAHIFFKLEEALDDLPTLLKIDLVDFNNTSEEFQKNALEQSDIIYG